MFSHLEFVGVFNPYDQLDGLRLRISISFHMSADSPGLVFGESATSTPSVTEICVTVILEQLHPDAVSFNSVHLYFERLLQSKLSLCALQKPRGLTPPTTNTGRKKTNLLTGRNLEQGEGANKRCIGMPPALKPFMYLLIYLEILVIGHLLTLLIL